MMCLISLERMEHSLFPVLRCTVVKALPVQGRGKRSLKVPISTVATSNMEEKKLEAGQCMNKRMVTVFVSAGI